MAIKILLSTRLGERRWTQADLARKTGIRPTTINEMFHEICERVNLDYLDRICEVLECDICDVMVRIPNGYTDDTYGRTRAGTGDKKQNT